MIPIRDENRSKTIPHMTRILILINIIFFIPRLYTSLFPQNITMRLFVASLYGNFTMLPADILQGKNMYTLFTSMFIHADILHIGGNMLFLYVFGDNVEDAFGHFRYLLFYFLCGVIADFAHILSLTSPPQLYLPTLGASGAISGVMGAYIVMYPRARIQTLIFGYFIALVRVPAVFFLGFWFLLQLLFSSFDIGGNVAYWAHIGGFVAGMILVFVFKKAQVPVKEDATYPFLTY